MTGARLWGRVWGWAAVVAAIVPAAAAAQERVLPPPAAVLVAGTMSYDDEESGSASVVGVRLDFPLSTWFTLEPGLERLAWTSDDDMDQVRWALDFALHAEYAFDRIVPYVGGNMGAVFDFDQDRELTEEFMEAIFGGHAGVRFDVTDRLGVRAEGRGRWYDRFDSTWILWTGGVSWRF